MSFQQTLWRFRGDLTAIHHLPDGNLFYFGGFCMDFVEFRTAPEPGQSNRTASSDARKPPDGGLRQWLDIGSNGYVVNRISASALLVDMLV